MGVLQRIAVSYMIAAVLIVLVRQSACSVSVSVPDQVSKQHNAPALGPHAPYPLPLRPLPSPSLSSPPPPFRHLL